MKAKIEQRKKSSDRTKGAESRSRSSSIDHPDSSSDAGAPEKIPSVMRPTPSGLQTPRRIPQSSPYLVRTVYMPAGFVQHADERTVCDGFAASAVIGDDKASLIQGYTAPGDCQPFVSSTIHPEYTWESAPCGNASDGSTHSRPLSACSDHSHSFSEASVSSQA